MRKSSVIQERMNLVSTHMYKQFLDYQNSCALTNEMFIKMLDVLELTLESLKKSFASRGIATQNISYEVDAAKTIITVQILWHYLSFTTRCNDKPQALYRDNETPFYSGRIIALKGNYFDILKKVDKPDFQTILEHEIASLYTPAEKNQNSIIKIKHLGNKEFYVNQMDSSKEFLLKVVETICGGGIFHEENFKKTLTF